MPDDPDFSICNRLAVLNETAPNNSAVAQSYEMVIGSGRDHTKLKCHAPSIHGNQYLSCFGLRISEFEFSVSVGDGDRFKTLDSSVSRCTCCVVEENALWFHHCVTYC